jgi:predicted peptidase
MQSRRTFLTMAAGSGVLIAVGAPVYAQSEVSTAKAATAIAQVFGEGVKLVAVAVEYPTSISGRDLALASFSVEGRTVTGVFVSTSSNPSDRADVGKFVIVTLSPDDANAILAQRLQLQSGGAEPPKGRGGPGKAGDVPPYDTIYRPPQVIVVQAGNVSAENGTVIPASDTRLETTTIDNLVVDDFRQLEFSDQKTGRSLKYNLFVPKNYDAAKSYPLVLFMHDAGATSDVTRTTLFQGLGAIAWASPEDQTARPCFVLAPQYAEIIADDDSRTSAMLDTTIDLVTVLVEEYSIDRNRLYATGQSGGCMMSIAMNIKYPDFFAASFLVAGQWDPGLVKPLAKKRLWILVSQDDDKAWPGENAITDALERQGAKISRAVWDGTWTADNFHAAFQKIDAERSPINYVAFRKGTVVPLGQSLAGAGGHRNTWRIAYSIPEIREWMFRQHL